MEQNDNKKDNSKDNSSCLDMSRLPTSEHLRTLFDLTDDVFNNVHAEVTAFLRTLLTLQKKDILSTKATFSLTSTILDHLLNQMNSALPEDFDYESSLHSSLIASASMETAEKLLLSTTTKMKEFWHLCIVSDWLSASRDLPVNIHEVLEDRLSYVTAEAVNAVFDCLLSICRKRPSGKFQDFGSDAPLYNFLQAVVHSIRAEDSPKAATPRESTNATRSNMVKETPSAVLPQADEAKKEDDPVGVPSDDVHHLESSHNVMYLSQQSQTYGNTLEMSADLTRISKMEIQRAICTPVVLQAKDRKKDSMDPEELAEIVKSCSSQPPEFWMIQPCYSREECSPFGFSSDDQRLHELANSLDGLTARSEPVSSSYYRDTETDTAESPGQIGLARNSFKTSWDPQADVSTCWPCDVENYRKVESRIKRILARILFRFISGDCNSDFCEALQAEASKLINSIVMDEVLEIVVSGAKKEQNLSATPGISSTLESCRLAASSEIINLLTSDLRSIFDEEFELPDPSVDPALYTFQIKLMSEKILKSTRAKLREILVMNLLMIFEMVICSHNNTELNNNLLSGSNKVVKSFVLSVKEASDSVSDIKGSVRRQFLESLEENLDLLSFRNTSTLEVNTGIEEYEDHPKLQDPQLSKNRSRLSFKKHMEHMEPWTVLSEKRTQENPVPNPVNEMAKEERPCNILQSSPVNNVSESPRAEDCIDALGATESAEENNPADPKPKKKNRVSAFFKRVWQKAKLTCICGSGSA